MESKLVSVIIPAFNHYNFIKKSILSVINQSYSNIELIVIDDCSTDNTREVIEDVLKDYEFIYSFHNKNMGISYTLKEGISLAKGEFIAFLASDDYWSEDKIENQVTFMESNVNCIACCNDNYTVDANDNIMVNDANVVEIQKYSFDDIMLGAHIPPASLMVRNSKILSDCYDTSIKTEDLYLWLKLTENDSYIYVIPKKLSYYRIHDNNTTANLSMIAEQHHKVIDLFKHKKTYSKAKLKWSLFSFRQLSGVNKREAMKYFIFKVDFIFSKSFFIGFLKIAFFKSKNKWG